MLTKLKITTIYALDNINKNIKIREEIQDSLPK